MLLSTSLTASDGGGNMAEYVDGNEKAPLQASQSAAGGKRAAQKPDWTRFGLSGGDGQPPARKSGSGAGDGETLNDEDAEVNEIYAEHEVCQLYNIILHC